jgi:two-component system sensor histidine kinase RegB
MKNSNYNHLKMLNMLRGLAIIGQIITIAYVNYLLNIPLPVWELYSIIILQIIVLAIGIYRNWQGITLKINIKDLELFAQLLIDMILLAALLFFTGGATNPFASLFILHVMIAAVILPAHLAWITSGVAIAIYTFLIFFNYKLDYLHYHHIGGFFNLHIHGMWIAFLLLCLCVAGFVVRMNNIIKLQNKRLIASEQIAAIGGLAANAAHALGTPLATLAILSEDIESELKAKMQNEIYRCKDIITQITQTNLQSNIMQHSQSSTPFKTLLLEIINQYSEISITNNINITDDLTIQINHEMQYILNNLINNAIEAGATEIIINARIAWRNFLLEIIDNGSGFSDIEKVGKNGFSTKSQGLGMSLVITGDIIVRHGGYILWENNRKSNGATITIDIPLKNIKY